MLRTPCPCDFAPRNIERLLLLPTLPTRLIGRCSFNLGCLPLEGDPLGRPVAIPDVMQYPYVALFPDPKATEGRSGKESPGHGTKTKLLACADPAPSRRLHPRFSLSDLADLNDLQF